jgi:hypothetical protein
MKTMFEKLRTLCDVLQTFVQKYPDCLDARAVGELGDISGKIKTLSETSMDCRGGIASARVNRDVAFKRLRRSIIECRSAIGMVTAHDEIPPRLPRLGRDLWSRALVVELAQRHLSIMETLKPDPALNRAYGSLKSAFDGYRQNSGRAAGKVFSSRCFKLDLPAELMELNGKLEGYKRVAAFHVPPNKRGELYALIRASVPRRRTLRRKNDVVEQTNVGQGEEPAINLSIATA